MTGAREGPMTDEPGASVRMPLSEEMLARYRWVVAPNRAFLRSVLHRAYRRKRMWHAVYSRAILITLAVFSWSFVLAYSGNPAGAHPIWQSIHADPMWCFFLIVIAVLHGRQRFEERALRRHVDRFPRWYALCGRRLGIRKEVREPLREAVRRRQSRRAWHYVYEIVDGPELTGRPQRWLRSGHGALVWNALVIVQYLFWLLLIPASTMPPSEPIKSPLFSGTLAGIVLINVVMLFMTAIASHRIRRIGILADAINTDDRCVQCDYDLRGLPPIESPEQPVIVCPECGTAHGV